LHNISGPKIRLFSNLSLSGVLLLNFFKTKKDINNLGKIYIHKIGKKIFLVSQCQYVLKPR
jgi:hypothetical protein